MHDFIHSIFTSNLYEPSFDLGVILRGRRSNLVLIVNVEDLITKCAVKCIHGRLHYRLYLTTTSCVGRRGPVSGLWGA